MRIGYPDRAMIRMGQGELVPLTISGDYVARFASGERVITLLPLKQKLRVLLAADNGLPITEVVLSWRVPIAKTAQIYGDAFERGYGDLGYRPIDATRRCYWYAIIAEMRHVTGWGIQTGANCFGYWQVTSMGVTLHLDVRAGRDPCERQATLHCVDVVCQSDYVSRDSRELFVTRFLKQLTPVPPCLPRDPVYGTNDWHHAYGNNSRTLTLATSEMLTKLTAGLKTRPFLVIDDGWQQSWTKQYNGGPWTAGNDKFGEMASLMASIKQQDILPGLWFRPLLTMRDRVVDPSTILTTLADQRVILDPSHPKVLAQIRADVQRFVSWGVKLLKYHFTTYDVLGLWGNEMAKDYYGRVVEFHDSSKTTAQIFKQLYWTIREAAGDMLVLGCNVVGHLAVGAIDIQRIGDDISGIDFAQTMRNGANALVNRQPQHRAFYLCDADCVSITPKIAWADNRRWLRQLVRSQTPLFVSVAPSEVDETLGKALRRAFVQVVQSADKWEEV